MSTDKAIAEVQAKCAENIEDYELRVSVALGVMDRERCPIENADFRLANEIAECVEEWEEENDEYGHDITVWDVIFS